RSLFSVVSARRVSSLLHLHYHLLCLRIAPSFERLFFLFTASPPSGIYPLSLHDALPIYRRDRRLCRPGSLEAAHHRQHGDRTGRSEEHTSELQSRRDLVCRLLLEKKK